MYHKNKYTKIYICVCKCMCIFIIINCVLIEQNNFGQRESNYNEKIYIRKTITTRKCKIFGLISSHCWTHTIII